MGLIVDTNSVVSMEREAKTPGTGRAWAFLEKHAEEQFFMPFTVAGELACGRSAADQRAWKRLCSCHFKNQQSTIVTHQSFCATSVATP